MGHSESRGTQDQPAAAVAGPPAIAGLSHRNESGNGSASAWQQRLRRHRYLVLLLLLVCSIIVQSIERRFTGLTAIAELLLSVSLFAMVLVVFEGRRSRLVALWFWVVVVTIGFTRYILPEVSNTWLEVLHRLLLVLFHGWAAALILRDVFEQERIGADDVLGAVSGYLLAAGGWGDLYYMFDLLAPGSFTISPDLAAQFADPQARSGLFNYFSLATITSVGYGDIAPARGPLTAIAMLETVFGQFYLAVVVAQLVGIRLAQGTQDKDGG